MLRGSSLVEGLNDYEALLDEKDYLDYSSILDEAVRTLRDDKEVSGRLRERVRYVIVDEYQDVNPIQECIVKLLHDLGARVCVVGDDDQTIYQWRGSDVQNILTFEKRYPEAQQIRLEENFRSSEGIVETARDFINQNAERLPKAMKPTVAQRYEPGDIVALSFDDPGAEALHIVTAIRALRGTAFKEDDTERGLAWSDMAILLRSVRNSAEPITEALSEAGIPFVIGGMNNLFATREAEAARQLFYFIRDRVDANGRVEAWVAADLGASLSAGARAVAGAREPRKLSENPTRSAGLVLAAAPVSLLPGRLGVARGVDSRWARRGGVLQPREVQPGHLGLRDHPLPLETGREVRVLRGFLEYRAENAYPEGWQDNQYANPDAVRIMTVHQAKGMQWPVVFIPALLRNRFPAESRAAGTSGTCCPGRRLWIRPATKASIEDERRLFYVAMTRSQKFLHLTWAPVIGNSRSQRVSEFWEDVLASKYVKRRPPTTPTRTAASDSARQRRERRLVVLRPQVLLRVSVPVQAAHPVRVQRTDP